MNMSTCIKLEKQEKLGFDSKTGLTRIAFKTKAGSTSSKQQTLSAGLLIWLSYKTIEDIYCMKKIAHKNSWTDVYIS